MLVCAGIQTPPLLTSPFLTFPKKSALTVSLLVYLCCLFSFCDIIPLSRIIWIYLTAVFHALLYQNAFWEPSEKRCWTGRKQDTFIDAICIDSYRFRCSFGSKVNPISFGILQLFTQYHSTRGGFSGFLSFCSPGRFNTLSLLSRRIAELSDTWSPTRSTQAATWGTPPAPHLAFSGLLRTLTFFCTSSASRNPPVNWGRCYLIAINKAIIK